MKKNKRLFILLTLYFSIGQIDAQIPLSFEESLHLLNQGNQSLKIADKSIEIAKAERDKLNAFWYPSLQSTGAFVHMSEKIEVKQPLSQFTDPAKDFVHSIIPDDHFDMDVLDPAEIIAAVGIEPNGMKIEEVVRIINDISSEYDLVGLTVAEPMPRVAIKLRNMLNQLPLLKD